MWPIHTWLPDAHVEAPTAGSVLLAAILLKMAGYGFIRFSLGLFPIASEIFTPLIYTLSVIAIILTSLIALMQEDMKKLIAYSSVAHMGFVTLGIFTLQQQGIEGSIIQMISHGLVSAALFLSVGVVYERHHTRLINRYGGLVQVMVDGNKSSAGPGGLIYFPANVVHSVTVAPDEDCKFFTSKETPKKYDLTS